MRPYSFILALLITLNCSAKSQDSLVTRIFMLAYNMNYQEAETLLEANKNNIDDFHFAVLDIDMSYWKNITGTDHPNYLEFEQTLERYEIENLENFHQKGLKLIQLSYKLRYQVKRFKLFSAISTHQNTKALYEEIISESELEKLESPELFQLYNSMFLYFSNYMKAFGGKSKKENCTQAIASMKQLAASQDIVTQTLASYFLGRTYLKYESEPDQGISYFQFLSDFYPKNKRFPALLEECKSKAK